VWNWSSRTSLSISARPSESVMRASKKRLIGAARKIASRARWCSVEFIWVRKRGHLGGVGGGHQGWLSGLGSDRKVFGFW